MLDGDDGEEESEEGELEEDSEDSELFLLMKVFFGRVRGVGGEEIKGGKREGEGKRG